MSVGASEQATDVEAPKLRDALNPRATLEEAHSPARVRPAAATRDVSVCVLSTDTALAHAIRRAIGGQYPVSTVTSWFDLVARIEVGDCCVAVLDTAAVGNRVARCIADLDRYSNRVVTLAAADRREAEQLVGYLSDRKIHRLLIKPLAAGITRLLLESAVARYGQLLDRPGADLDATGTHFAPVVVAQGSRLAGLVDRWINHRWIVGAASLLVAGFIGGLGWVLWPSAPAAGTDTARPAASPAMAPVVSPAVSVAQPIERFAELVARAERALVAGRLAEPAGDNALDYYLTILAADPLHRLAQDRLAVVVDALFTQAESALLDNSLDTARAILANLRRADPGSARLTFLEAQLERARRDTSPPAGAALAGTQSAGAGLSAAEAPSGKTAPTELESLVTIAHARIVRSQLLEPPGDSAVHYVERAARVDAADPRVRAASAELVTALVAGARAALSDDDLEAASRMLEQAQRFGGRPNVARLASDIAAARSAQLLARARARLQAGALSAPESDSALHYLTLLGGDADKTADVSAVWADLSARLAEQAQRALDARDWAAGESVIAALERANRDPETVALLRRGLLVGRTQEQYLAAAAPGSALALVSYTVPEYPAEARQRDIEGWVDVEFVVDTMGFTRNVTAVAGEPAGRFEQAAIEAVSMYRYEPFTLDGQVYERRLRVRMRFALQ
jgi:TonB family protein